MACWSVSEWGGCVLGILDMQYGCWLWEASDLQNGCRLCEGVALWYRGKGGSLNKNFIFP